MSQRGNSNPQSPNIFIDIKSNAPVPIRNIPTSIAAIMGIGANGNCNTLSFLTNVKEYNSKVGKTGSFTYLSDAVSQFFLNGGAQCFVGLLPSGEASSAPAIPAKAGVPGVSPPEKDVLIFIDRESVGGETDKDKVVIIEETNEKLEGDDSNGEALPHYTIKVKDGGSEVEVFEGLTVSDISAAVNNPVKGSKYVRVKELVQDWIPETFPVAGEYQLVKAESSALTSIVGTGDTEQRSGFKGLLEANDEPSILLFPDLPFLLERQLISLDQYASIQASMVDFAEEKGMIAVLDAPYPDMRPTEMRDYVSLTLNKPSSYGVMYYPWIMVQDQSTGRARPMPPSCAVVGQWSACDSMYGIHRSPAGEKFPLKVARDVTYRLSAREQDILYPIGINSIVFRPGRGIIVNGARTLDGNGAFRYLNHRRLINKIANDVSADITSVQFESNDPATWAKLKRSIGNYLDDLWRKGALFGTTPEEAFIVVCDSSNNPPESIAQGKLCVEVYVAPVTPAEFIMLSITKTT